MFLANLPNPEVSPGSIPTEPAMKPAPRTTMVSPPESGSACRLGALTAESIRKTGGVVAETLFSQTFPAGAGRNPLRVVAPEPRPENTSWPVPASSFTQRKAGLL